MAHLTRKPLRALPPVLTFILVLSSFLSTPVAIQKAQAAYSFTSHTFTPCGATGATGPTLSQCTSAYTTSWDENVSNFNVVSGIQYWTVPNTGRYSIEAGGAKGGNGNSGTGGSGAKIKGEFNLTEGEVIRILVGQSGVDHPIVAGGTNATGGGGGGSFVVRTPFNSNASILVVAGGGGGSGSSIGGGSGQTTTSGQAGLSSGSGAGGVNGGGGGAGASGAAGTATTDGGVGGSCSYGAGGGGFFTNGGLNCNGNTPYTRGLSFLNGGTGGPADASRSGVSGGFGGGSGSGHRAPGGGGYSGGGGDGNATGGGGGGSYNSGGNQVNISGINSTTGFVTISVLEPPTISIGSLSGTFVATKGQVFTLTSTIDQAGRVTFYADGKRIPGCINMLASIGSISCAWKPTTQKPATIFATISQNNAVANTSSTILISVTRRMGTR